MCEWLNRLWTWVAPNGRLILGSYGSQSRRTAPDDVEVLLVECGFVLSGSSRGGDGPITRYAWADRRDGLAVTENADSHVLRRSEQQLQ